MINSLKTRLYIFCFLLGGSIVFAQDAEIKIEQDQKIDKMLSLYKEANKNLGYYRIQIYWGSKTKSNKIREEARIAFPDWSTKIEFDEPNFKVKIGKFKTKLEAERQLIEVRKQFPSALLPNIKTTD